jgi:hypothetical protein
MCAPGTVSKDARSTVPRPRWARLYGVSGLGLAVLAVASLGVSEGARSGLAGIVAGALLVGFLLWIRANRVALEQRDSCACAREAVTARVITARRPAPSAPPVPPAVRSRRRPVPVSPRARRG